MLISNILINPTLKLKCFIFVAALVVSYSTANASNELQVLFKCGLFLLIVIKKKNRLSKSNICSFLPCGNYVRTDGERGAMLDAIHFFYIFHL